MVVSFAIKGYFELLNFHLTILPNEQRQERVNILRYPGGNPENKVKDKNNWRSEK